MRIWGRFPVKPKRIKPLPYCIYFWSVVAIVSLGLVDSIYLAFSHYRTHTDILYTSFCAISESLNCDKVSQSPYAIFLGVPLAVWGGIGYTCVLLTLFLARVSKVEKERLWALIFLSALFFSLISIVLAGISRYLLRVYCPMCIASYGINFLLVYFIWIIRRRFPENGFFHSLKKDGIFLLASGKKKQLGTIIVVCCIILLPTIFPSYWQYELPRLQSDIATGFTEDGSPWIGAVNPEIVVTEYTDYKCFQCKKKHAYLRLLVYTHHDTVRLVHRHFPMDSRFNPNVKRTLYPGSGEMAVLAAYAATENRFWQMNDLLYKIPHNSRSLDLKKLASDSGVTIEGLKKAYKNKRVIDKIHHDVAIGMSLGMRGTPAYEINKKIYQGRIPEKILELVNRRD